MDHETHNLVDLVTYVGPGVMFVGSIILRIISGVVSSPPTSATLILASGVLIVTGIGACLLKLLHYMVRMHASKRKFRKLIGNYVSSGAKEKRVFEAQMERLDAQLQEKRIEQETYERLRTLLETRHLQHQQEEWAKIEDKVHNPLS